MFLLLLAALPLTLTSCAWGDDADNTRAFVGTNGDGDLVVRPAAGQRVLVNGIDVLQATMHARLTHDLLCNSDPAPRAPRQLIPTNGATDFEYFEIPGRGHFLALSSSREDAVVVMTLSELLGTFVTFQVLSVLHPRDAEYINFGDGDHYLGVASYRNSTDRHVNSKLFRFNGTAFEEYQDLPSIAAEKVKQFAIDDDQFVVVVNHEQEADDATVIDSTVYRWNGTRLLPFTTVSGSLVYDAEPIVDGDNVYLVLVQQETDSYVVKYNRTSRTFDHHQTLVGRSGEDAESWTMDGEVYVALPSYDTSATVAQNTIVYKLDSTSGLFEVFQSLPAPDAEAAEHFVIDGQHYLAVALFFSVSNVVESPIFHYNGTSFVQHQTYQTSGGHDFEFFEVNGIRYLAAANFRNMAVFEVNSEIRRWNNCPDGLF
eukprot:m.278372 g.278372  ORF g.278372 m.278372 type:complete len:428 (-) comp19381_c0_seq5:7-1290(-)